MQDYTGDKGWEIIREVLRAIDIKGLLEDLRTNV
jgi:hypothetical protein